MIISPVPVLNLQKQLWIQLWFSYIWVQINMVLSNFFSIFLFDFPSKTSEKGMVKAKGVKQNL